MTSGCTPGAPREAAFLAATFGVHLQVAGGPAADRTFADVISRGVLGYLLVTIGGLATAVLPESSPLATLPVLGDLRASLGGRMAGLAVVMVGVGIAAAAWLRLLRYVGRGGPHDEVLRLVLVRRATFLWSLPLLLAPPMFSRDGWSYAAQGVMARLGISPYSWTPSVLEGPIVEAVDPRWMGTAAPYGPVPLAWGGLAATFTQDPWLLVVAHRVFALGGLVMLAWALPRLARWAGKDRALVSALVLPSPLVLGHGIAGVHNDLVMVGLMALALVVAAETRGWVLGAVLTGLAAAVKVPAGLVGIGVALVSLGVLAGTGARVRRLLAVAAVAVAALLTTGVLTGVGAGWVHALGVPGEVHTPLSASTQLGNLTGWVLDLLGLPGGGEALVTARTLGSLVGVGAATVVALRAPTGVPAAAVRAVALVMLVVLVTGPVVHPWYLLWALPLLAVGHWGRRGTSALLLALCLPGIVAPLDSSLEGLGTLVTLGVVLAAAVAVWLVRPLRETVAGPAPARLDAGPGLLRPGSGARRGSGSGPVGGGQDRPVVPGDELVDDAGPAAAGH